MRPKLYIDGQAGTTALRIRDWLQGRDDLELVVLPEELRKDPAARQRALFRWQGTGMETAGMSLRCMFPAHATSC